LNVNAVFLVKGGADPRKWVEIDLGPDHEHVNVGGWTRESVQHGHDKAAKAMKLDGPPKLPVKVS